MNFIGKLFGSNKTPFLSKTEKKYRKLVKRPFTNEDIKKQRELEKAIELCAPLAKAYRETFELSEKLKRGEITHDVYMKKFTLLKEKVSVLYQRQDVFEIFVGAAVSQNNFSE